MGILSRCRDILTSNINALLDKAEDPAKMVDQYLLDARRDLAECKSETAGVMAAEKSAKRALDECKANVSKYEDAARRAVKAGNDNDARELLASKQRHEAQLPQLEKNYASAHESAENMRKLTEKLTNDINELEARKQTVKGTVAAAKAQEAANRFGSRSDYGAEASEGLSRMEQKANERLDRATAAAELDDAMSADEDLLDKYSHGGSASVDDELARLKAEMSGDDEPLDGDAE